MNNQIGISEMCSCKTYYKRYKVPMQPEIITHAPSPTAAANESDSCGFAMAFSKISRNHFALSCREDAWIRTLVTLQRHFHRFVLGCNWTHCRNSAQNRITIKDVGTAELDTALVCYCRKMTLHFTCCCCCCCCSCCSCGSCSFCFGFHTFLGNERLPSWKVFRRKAAKKNHHVAAMIDQKYELYKICRSHSVIAIL